MWEFEIFIDFLKWLFKALYGKKKDSNGSKHNIIYKNDI
jgi:hypothetical protein